MCFQETFSENLRLWAEHFRPIFPTPFAKVKYPCIILLCLLVRISFVLLAIQHKEKSWYDYLIKNLTGARKAAEHLFNKVICVVLLQKTMTTPCRLISLVSVSLIEVDKWKILNEYKE